MPSRFRLPSCPDEWVGVGGGREGGGSRGFLPIKSKEHVGEKKTREGMLLRICAIWVKSSRRGRSGRERKVGVSAQGRGVVGRMDKGVPFQSQSHQSPPA